MRSCRSDAAGADSLKILIVRVSSLGDVVHNMPMVQDILRHDPTAIIDWVVEEGYVNLVRLTRGVRKIIPFALRRWRKSLLSAATRAEIRAFRAALQGEEYDFVFDTQGLLKTGAVMGWARLAAGGKKVGLANASEGSGYEALSRIFHTMSVRLDPRTHAVARARLVAGAALGYAVDSDADFGLQQTPGRPDDSIMNGTAWLPRQAYAVFFHGTARDAKKWAARQWIEIGRALDRQGLLILLPWGNPAEKAEAELLAAHLPNARVLPALPLLDAVLLARCASVVIGVDTGLTHIAAAFARPTIELYCDSPRWKTEGNWSSNIINLGQSGSPPSVAEVQAALVTLGFGVADGDNVALAAADDDDDDVNAGLAT
jgi:heptosyltransferase-1